MLPVVDMIRRERNQRYFQALQMRVNEMPVQELRDYVTRIEEFERKSYFAQIIPDLLGKSPNREIYIFAKSRIEKENNIISSS